MSERVIFDAAPVVNQIPPSEQPESQRRRFAVLEIKVPGDFAPSEVGATPQPTLDSFAWDLVRPFIVQLNKSDRLAIKNRWAVPHFRSGFLLINLALADRPSLPHELPASAERGFQLNEARRIAAERNLETFRLARIPRTWFIAVTDFAAVDQVNAAAPARVLEDAYKVRVFSQDRQIIAEGSSMTLKDARALLDVSGQLTAAIVAAEGGAS